MNGTSYTLVIGNKNYSSWSLRPWLAMRRFGIPFTEINIDIYVPDPRERILEHSPSAKVPALKMNGHTIWDTMAILETLAEAHAEYGWWPAEKRARAAARSVSAEMHSGFAALRDEMPMDLLREKRVAQVPQDVARDIGRVLEIWRMCRSGFGSPGPFLFGDFSIADAMYAPVASRLRTYVGDLAPFGGDGACATYMETIFAMPEMAEWAEGAAKELKRHDAAY